MRRGRHERPIRSSPPSPLFGILALAEEPAFFSRACALVLEIPEARALQDGQSGEAFRPVRLSHALPRSLSLKGACNAFGLSQPFQVEGL